MARLGKARYNLVENTRRYARTDAEEDGGFRLSKIGDQRISKAGDARIWKVP